MCRKKPKPPNNPLVEKTKEDKGQDSNEEDDPEDYSGADLVPLEKATDLLREKVLPDPTTLYPH